MEGLGEGRWNSRKMTSGRCGRAFSALKTDFPWKAGCSLQVFIPQPPLMMLPAVTAAATLHFLVLHLLLLQTSPQKLLLAKHAQKKDF